MMTHAPLFISRICVGMLQIEEDALSWNELLSTSLPPSRCLEIVAGQTDKWIDRQKAQAKTGKGTEWALEDKAAAWDCRRVRPREKRKKDYDEDSVFFSRLHLSSLKCSDTTEYRATKLVWAGCAGAKIGNLSKRLKAKMMIYKNDAERDRIFRCCVHDTHKTRTRGIWQEMLTSDKRQQLSIVSKADWLPLVEIAHAPLEGAK